uniref:SAP domain-containing protein n=1 Tax=Schistocephalus solidus TaxID=70667 RepID=A0A183TNW3_SCHSO
LYPMPEEEETSLHLPDGRKLNELKVSDLKKELENRGLNKSGVKKELVQRLAEQVTVSEPTEVEVNGVQEVAGDNATDDFSSSQAADTVPPSSNAPSVTKPVEPTEDLLPSSPLLPRPPITATAEMEAEEEDYEDENMDTIPPLEPVPAPEAPLQAASQPRDASNHQPVDILAKSPAPAPTVKRPPSATSAPSSRPPKETRGVGYLAEGPERIEPAAENRHPPTELVYIRFLMRPFTPGQLSKMIESQFGKVRELWLDKIKSSAVVRMETQEAAKSEALLEWLKEHGDSGDRNPPRHLLIGAPPPPPEKTEGRARESVILILLHLNFLRALYNFPFIPCPKLLAVDKSSSNQRKPTSSTSGEKSSSRTLAGSHTERRRKLAEETPAVKAEETTGEFSSQFYLFLQKLY